MASVDEGNNAIAAVEEIVTDAPVNVSDTLMIEDPNGVTTVTVEAVEEEVSTTEDRAEPAADHSAAVDSTGGDNAEETAIPIEEQAVQSVENAGAGSDVVMVNDAVEDTGPQIQGDEVADHVVDTPEDADQQDAVNEEDDNQQHEEHGEKVHAADEHHDNGDETDDDDERYQDDADHTAEDGDVVHNDDEYDPANPNLDGDTITYDPAHHADSTAHAEDEYDPANPAEGFTNGREKKEETATSPVHKRKLSDTPAATSTASPAALSASARSPKRPRTNAPRKVDQRGLKHAAWDRLMDFESTGEFRIAQVSRAAFSSIAELPDFAQCAIVARFTRTPMKDVRDKNDLVLRICREYLSEHPRLSSMPPVSLTNGATADPGLFAYGGYAPPMPTSGMSSVKIPYRQDKPGTISTTSAPSSSSPQKLIKLAAAAMVTPELDEFGREIKPKAGSSTPRKDEQQTLSKTTAAALTQASPSAVPVTGKPSDPRRRRQGAADAAPTEHVRVPPTADDRGQIAKSDVYNRLPISVRSRLDSLIAARRLPEGINDNVLSRLNHLPESTAVTAIEKFMESDLGQIGNVNGFLVGIINRVQDRIPTPSDPRSGATATRSAPPSAPGATFHQQQHPSHQPQQHFSQHAPAAPRGYTSSPSPAPVGHPHPSFEHAPGNDFRGHQMQQPPMTAAPVGYDMRKAGQPPPAYAPDPQLAWNQAHTSAPAPHVGQPGRFSNQPTIDQAVAKLPVMIQNHLVSLVNSRILPSLEDLSEKCYEVLGQLSEGLANDVLKRFGTANLSTIRNRSAFLMGVVNKCREEYGFD